MKAEDECRSEFGEQLIQALCGKEESPDDKESIVVVLKEPEETYPQDRKETEDNEIWQWNE